MQNMQERPNKPVIPIILTIISIIIAVYFGILNYNLTKEKYTIETRPLIKYGNRIFFTEYSIYNKEITSTDSNKFPIGVTPAIIELSFNLKLINIGKGLAKWKKVILLDFPLTKENDTIRTILLKNNLEGIFQNKYESNIKKELKEINPMDTINLGNKKIIQGITTENETTLHLLFLYEGENKVLYDTYMWIHLQFEDTMKIALKNDIHKPGDFIKADINCCDTKIYSEDEKNTAYKLLGIKEND